MHLNCSEGPLALWLVLMRAHATLVEAVGRTLEEHHGLPLAWHEVLVQLEVSEGRLRMQTLAERVLLSRSGLTRLCDRMEDAGLIARESCDRDRRGTFATITPEGRKLLRRACPAFLAGVEQHFDALLDPAERVVLMAVLQRVADGRAAVISS